MGADNGATAHIQGRTDELINPQRFGADRGTDDVHQRVGCSDLMKMNFVDGHAVDFRFSRAKLLKNRYRDTFCRSADPGFVDDFEDFR
jgi:hypothetical protein